MFFEKIHEKIQEFIRTYHITPEDNFNSFFKLSTSDAIFCGQDGRKNHLFFNAFKQSISDQKRRQIKKQKICVLDAGSGTGVLGALALATGADICYFLEQNPYSFELSKKLLNFLGYSKKSVFVHTDALKWKPPEPFDILVSETLVSGLLREDFGHIMNHFQEFSHKNTLYLPENLIVQIKIKNFNNYIIGEKKIYINTSKPIKKWVLEIFLSQKPNNISVVEWHTQIQIYKKIGFSSGDCSSVGNIQYSTAANIDFPFFYLKYIYK